MGELWSHLGKYKIIKGTTRINYLTGIKEIISGKKNPKNKETMASV